MDGRSTIPAPLTPTGTTATGRTGSRAFLWIATALTFLLVAVLAAIAALVPTPRYEASATVGVRPDSTSAGSWQLTTFLLPSVQADATSRRLRADVLERLAGEVPEGAAWTVTTGVEPGTGVLEVTVSSEDREVVAPVADTYASALVAAYLADPALDLRLIDSAEPPASPASPDRLLILSSGGALGLILAGLVALLLQRRRQDRARAGAQGASSPPLPAPYPVGTGTAGPGGTGSPGAGRAEVLAQRSGARQA